MRQVADCVGVDSGEVRLAELIKKCTEVKENIQKSIETDHKLLADHLENLHKG